jgi:uncharacterized membrane protein (DUF4010 family)
MVVLLVAAHLIAKSITERDRNPPGSTSFASALITLFCGALVAWDEMKSAVVVAAISIVVVGLKHPIHTWTRSINERDIRATLQFVAISGVVLPLVPNRDLGPFGGFNPFSTWLMVVLISGFGFAGYIASRIVKTHAGIVLTAVLGGIVSSTATTLAFSRRSREEPQFSNHYAIAVIAACTVMLPRVLITTSLVNRDFAQTLIVPFAAMAVPGLAYVLWVWFRQRPELQEGDAPHLGNPLSLGTAIKFAALFSVIAILVKAVGRRGWADGLLPLSFISGLTDMDAISLSIARDHGTDQGAFELASRAVVVAAVSNTLAKAGIAVVLGSPGLKVRIGIVLGATLAVGALWVLFGPAVFPFGTRTG